MLYGIDTSSNHVKLTYTVLFYFILLRAYFQLENNVKSIGIGFYEGKGESSSGPILFPALKKFSLFYMGSLVDWMVPAVGNRGVVFPCVEGLSVTWCQQLTSIPISQFSSLVQLEIRECGELSYLSRVFHAYTSLQVVIIISCPSLVSIPSVQNIASLKRLRIARCNKLTALLSGSHFAAVCGKWIRTAAQS